MEFIYFEGPESDMADLIDKPHSCSICGMQHPNCYALDYADTAAFTKKQREGKVGCYDCLKKGLFTFSHDTEYGLVDHTGVNDTYRHNGHTLSGASDLVITELSRTPQFVTYQQGMWLGHCNDFMVYKGTWRPQDFIHNAEGGNGRALFLDMTPKDQAFFWDDQDGAESMEDWYITYYTFECRHCGKLRGYWDCD